jgi:hypothetical protein
LQGKLSNGGIRSASCVFLKRVKSNGGVIIDVVVKKCAISNGSAPAPGRVTGKRGVSDGGVEAASRVAE